MEQFPNSTIRFGNKELIEVTLRPSGQPGNWTPLPAIRVNFSRPLGGSFPEMIWLKRLRLAAQTPWQSW